jgi:hypothetical protein
MRADDEVVVLDHEIANRRRRQVVPQRLPVIAIVKRDEDRLFGAGIQQPAPLRILANHADDPAVGNAARDVRPRLAAVVGAVDVRPQVVETQRVDRGVSGVHVEVRRIHDRHLHPRRECRRRDVLPVLAAITRQVNQSVVGPSPNRIFFNV